MDIDGVQRDLEQLRAEVKRLYVLIEAERSDRIASIGALENQISLGMASIRNLLEQLAITINAQDTRMQMLFTELKAHVTMLADRDRLKDDQLVQVREQINNLTSQISMLTTISAQNAASVELWQTFRTDALDLMRGLAVKIDAQAAEAQALRLDVTRLTTRAATEARFERRDAARIKAVLNIMRAILRPQNALLIIAALIALGGLGEGVLLAIAQLLQ